MVCPSKRDSEAGKWLGERERENCCYFGEFLLRSRVMIIYPNRIKIFPFQEIYLYLHCIWSHLHLARYDTLPVVVGPSGSSEGIGLNWSKVVLVKTLLILKLLLMFTFLPMYVKDHTFWHFVDTSKVVLKSYWDNLGKKPFPWNTQSLWP